jgi:peptidyl-prolyl cis-trans isomerase SurA
MQITTRISAILFCCTVSMSAFAQPDSFQLLDGIIAVVGDEIILHSEMENRVFQEKLQGKTVTLDNRCSMLEEMLFEKLLLHNARIDSLVVTDAEVMDEIDRRLAYYINMFGSIEAFEAEYGKSVTQWKDDFGKPIKSQLLAGKMQSSINQEVRATPAEVLEYYENTPVDSLPLIPEEISYSELVIQPQISEIQRQNLRNKVDSIRNLVASGKLSMTLAATRYSEDPGSKYKGGCYTNIGRGQFVPEFEAAVFDTPTGGYSGVFETDFGFHFLRVTEKRGEQFSACHVLMKPKVNPLALELNGATIDSVYQDISSGKITFDAAVLQYSTQETSANQRGQIVNARDGGTRFGIDELDPNIYFILDPLEEGGVSEPVQLIDADGNGYWTMLRLDARHIAHRANPQDDYALFQSQVENILRMDAMNEWVSKNISSTYIRIDPTFDDCEFQMNWYEYIWSSQKEK